MIAGFDAGGAGLLREAGGRLSQFDQEQVTLKSLRAQIPLSPTRRPEVAYAERIFRRRHRSQRRPGITCPCRPRYRAVRVSLIVDGRACRPGQSACIKISLHAGRQDAAPDYVLAGVGFMVAGVPGAALLAFLIFVVAAFPGGPLLVGVFPVFWLYRQGAIEWTVIIAIWVVIVGNLDSLLRPLSIARGGGDMPLILVLLGVIRGAMPLAHRAFPWAGAPRRWLQHDR